MNAEQDRRLRRNVAGALRLAWGASPRGFTVTAGLALGSAALPPVVVWLGKGLVDLMVLGQRAPLRPLVVTVLALGIVAAAERTIATMASNRQEVFSSRVGNHAERTFLDRTSRADLGHVDDPVWHDRVARARRDVDWRPYQLTWSVIGLGSSSLSVLGMLGLLLSLHPALVVGSLASVLPAVVIQRRINRRLYSFWFTTTPEQREREYLRNVLSQPRWIKEIHAFGLGHHFRSRHAEIADMQHGRLAKLFAVADRYALVSGLLSGIALTAAYGFVAARGRAGALTPGDLAAVIGAFAGVTAQVSLLSSSLLFIDQHAQFLDDYFSFLEVRPLVTAPREPVTLPASLEPGFELDRVTFTYPGTQYAALQDVSLRIGRGELLALVGENGAGKTTIVKLLLRLYDPHAGSVRLGGVDLRDVDPAALRSRIGVLFQDFASYELSVRENVVLGRVERQASDADIEAALRAARADEVVKRLPRGLDSNVGRLFEGGHDLSGGEWQRLALARLLYRDADVWILDEPTSTLDPEAEAGIFAELRENLRGRIGIVISHRFSTVRIADRIAVVQDGCVTELGSHEELLALGGRYARLFELQAAGYR